MSADLAVLNSTDVEQSSDPAAYIVLACQRAKGWLASALDGAHIEEIVETKSQAEALRVYATQKQLGHDAELAAAEIVRRAERCIGLAIRKGQEAGKIAGVGDRGGRPEPGVHGSNPGVIRGEHLDSPHTLIPEASRSALSSTYYAQTDGVSDEQYDAAIDKAKAEGNLSRANVKRKVTGIDPHPRSDRPEHLHKTRRFDANRVIDQTVNAAVYLTDTSIFDSIDYSTLSRELLPTWISSLDDSIDALNAIRRNLKKELNQ